MEEAVSTWRRKALESFPELRRDLNRRDYSIYRLFADLRRMLWEAHEASDVETLRKIYGYSEWCLSQRSKDVWNPAGVSFYEHLFDRKDRRYWAQVVPWLSPRVVRDVWALWEWRLEPDELQELREMLAKRDHARQSGS